MQSYNINIAISNHFHVLAICSNILNSNYYIYIYIYIHIVSLLSGYEVFIILVNL